MSMLLLNKIYDWHIVQCFLGTDRSNLRRLVDQNWSVLDLGCGSKPPVLLAIRPKAYFGIDVFKPSIDSARLYCISENLEHYQFEVRNLESAQFDENQFDIVILIDVIEHLPKEIGIKLIENAKNWASRRVYISTPNGFLKQDPYDSNSFQEHLSGWTVNEFKSLGFTNIRGGGGLKLLRKREMQPDQWSHVSGASLRWGPRLLWALVSAMSQVIFKRIPSWSYQIVAVFEK